MDDALDALKHFKKGIKSLECAMCQYTEEFEPTDPYDTKRHPFKRQFENTFEGICGIFLLINFFSILLCDLGVKKMVEFLPLSAFLPLFSSLKGRQDPVRKRYIIFC